MIFSCKRSVALCAGIASILGSTTFAAPTKSSPPAKASTPPAPTVAALVNGEKIMMAELNKAVDFTIRRSQMMPSNHPLPERSVLQKKTLDDLIGQKLILQDAAKRKIVVDAKEVEAELTKVKANFPQSEDTFNKMLKNAGFTIVTLRTDIRNQLTVRKVVDRDFSPKVKVTDEAVADFYGKNTSRFAWPEQTHARHILIMLKPEATDDEKKAAESKANDLLARVQKGEDFSELAKGNSDDPGSKGQGGDLGFFPKGMMVPQFEEAAFTLKPGEVSKVISTPYGYHIIKCEEKRDAGTAPLDKVKDDIKSFLTNQEIGRMLDDHVTRLRKTAKVKILLKG